MKTSRSSAPSFTTWRAIPVSTWMRPPGPDLVALRRIAEVHGDPAADRDVGLLLQLVVVPPALSAGLVPEEVRAGVLEAGLLGHACGVARGLAHLVRPGLVLEVRLR